MYLWRTCVNIQCQTCSYMSSKLQIYTSCSRLIYLFSTFFLRVSALKALRRAKQKLLVVGPPITWVSKEKTTRKYLSEVLLRILKYCGFFQTGSSIGDCHWQFHLNRPRTSSSPCHLWAQYWTAYWDDIASAAMLRVHSHFLGAFQWSLMPQMNAL